LFFKDISKKQKHVDTRIRGHDGGAWIGIQSMCNRLNAWRIKPMHARRKIKPDSSGPPLTMTDVVQRLKAFEDEEYYAYPKEELQPDCLALYEKEKAVGTELPAIIGLLRDHLEREEERLHAEQQERYRQRQEEDRVAREQRLLSGADCKWTQLRESPNWYCRYNGRTYRLLPTKDKMWHLHHVNSVSDDEEGALIGKYQRRGDATKVVAQIAYQPEPKW
jgi:hypothetical protein